MSDIKTESCLQKKLSLNYKRNLEFDQTKNIEEAASRFSYEVDRDAYWNPVEYSLLYGTPLWEQASPSQRLVSNHLYWVAYYAQIVSAEIATIFFNQVSAAGLYAKEEFAVICNSLDLESKQERTHIKAFREIGETVELMLFGERLFTYPMRGLFNETMVFSDSNVFKTAWRNLQIMSFWRVNRWLLVSTIRSLLT